MSLRIGFDITPLSVSRSGVGTYTARLLEQLLRGPDDIVPLSQYPAGGQKQGSNHNGRSKLFNKTLWMQLGLPRELQRLQPDICHFTNHVAPLWLPYPFILTIHDMTLWLYPSYHPLRRLITMRPVIPSAARRAAAIVTVSHSAKADIVRILGVPARKVRVIHEAPGKEFHPLEPGNGNAVERALDLAFVQEAYHLPDQFILHVGTLEPRKNLVRLIEAFAILRKKEDTAHHLVLVGQRGWKWQKIFAAIERLELENYVHYLDYVPGSCLPAMYNLADALVYPSLYEGFGLPVVEAMASGLPVITTARGALPEVAGDAALMVDPEEVESIAQGIHRLIADRGLHQSLRNRGLERAQRFSWSKTAEQTRQVYWEVASGEQSLVERGMLRRPAAPRGDHR